MRRLQDAQNQLLQSDKMASIGQLAAGIAHEINNPVGYISSNLATFKLYTQQLFGLLAAFESSKCEFSEQTKRKLDAIKSQIDADYLMKDLQDLLLESEEGLDRVKKIVQDLKDFSHVDEAQWQWSNLHDGLDSTLNIVNNEIKYKAEVVKEYGDIPPVECLASQINQVFMNILINAAYAIEEQGKIIIRTGPEGGRVWVDIEDTGKGMTAQIRQRIFDPFYTTKPIGEGTGMGLSLSYSIVRKHHGHIEVDSEPGRGSRFRIWLPVAQPGRKPGGNG
jgi:signal transduction histidine kinase